MGEREIDYLISKNVEKTMNQVQNEPYWTPLEREVLYEEVSKRIEVIDGKFKGASSGKAEKNRAWLEITDVVNAQVAQLFLNMLKIKWDNHNNYFQNNFLICIFYWFSSSMQS